MYHHPSGAGKYEEVCTTLRCSYSKLKPKATHFNTTEGRWVCFPCAQEANRHSTQTSMKYGFPEIKRPCISSQEYMMAVLLA